MGDVFFFLATDLTHKRPGELVFSAKVLDTYPDEHSYRDASFPEHVGQVCSGVFSSLFLRMGDLTGGLSSKNAVCVS